jgi:hypothetical protein
MDPRQPNGPDEPEINPRDNLIPYPLAEDTPQSAPRPEKFTARLPYLRITLTTSSSDSLKKLRKFLSGERFPLSGYQSVKCQMHDPNTTQREYPISQDLAHTPNLSIASLGEDNAEL